MISARLILVNLLFCTLCAACYPIDSGAELPPSAYANRQKFAEEELHIRVLAADVVEQEWGLQITLQAEVLLVGRTTSQLSPGALVTIVYGQKNNPEGLVGPGPVPLLQSGEEVPAFLDYQENDNLYLPAAGSASFDEPYYHVGSSNLGFEPIYFDRGTAEMSETERKKMWQHAKALKLNSGMVLRIEGHAQGSDDFMVNYYLGEERAQQVAMYLISLGVAKKQLLVISYGEEMPVAFGQDNDASAKNNRVDFRWEILAR